MWLVLFFFFFFAPQFGNTNKNSFQIKYFDHFEGKNFPRMISSYVSSVFFHHSTKKKAGMWKWKMYKSCLWHFMALLVLFSLSCFMFLFNIPVSAQNSTIWAFEHFSILFKNLQQTNFSITTLLNCNSQLFSIVNFLHICWEVFSSIQLIKLVYKFLIGGTPPSVPLLTPRTNSFFLRKRISMQTSMHFYLHRLYSKVNAITVHITALAIYTHKNISTYHLCEIAAFFFVLLLCASVLYTHII